MTPEALLLAHLAGDRRAFPALYRALAPSVAALCLRLTRSRAMADDIAQTTWCKVHRAAATYRPGAAVEPWVRQIARNAWLDACRAQRRSRVVLTATGDAPEPAVITATDGDAWDRFTAAEQATLRAAIAALPASQREVITALKVDGLSLIEAAAQLGTTVGAVKLRAHRAYESVRAAMGVTPMTRAA